MGIVTGIAVDTLTKKLGPLPIWVWAILVGGGAGAVLVLHNRSQAAADTSASGSADTTGTPQDTADASSSMDPYSNYLDTGGLYNGYGASDLGSYGPSAGGGAGYPYPTSQAPQTVVAKLDPALLKQLLAIRLQLRNLNKKKAHPPKRPPIRRRPPNQQPHTAFGPAGHSMTGGGQTRRNVQSHFVV